MTPEEQHAAKRLGTVLGGRWTLERVLGVGGMAAVYAARAPDGSVAAVKLLHSESRLNPETRQRFLREGQAANRVEHPGAVKVLDHATIDADDTAYLVMELLEGESLAERRTREPLTPDELLDVLDQTLDVLAAAHQRGIVHRDLKPDNLFVTREGRVKVLDFGIARFLDAVPGEVKTRTGIAMGTLPYMAPEQALGKRDQIDGRTDLFALGAVAFRLLTGRRVHEAESEAALLVAMATKPAPPIASVLPEVPRWIAAIIDLSLAFAPEARYPDARTMQSDVRAVRAGKAPPHATRVSSKRDEATRAELPRVVASAPTVRAATPPSPSPAPTLAKPANLVSTSGTPPGYAVTRLSAQSPSGQPDAARPALDKRVLYAGAGLALLLLVALLVGALLAVGGSSSTASEGADGGAVFLPTLSDPDEPTPSELEDKHSRKAREKAEKERKKKEEQKRDEEE